MSTNLKSQSKGISLVRFFGGIERGVCVQIHNSNEPMNGVSVTRHQAKALAKSLLEFANNAEEPDYEA